MNRLKRLRAQWRRLDARDRLSTVLSLAVLGMLILTAGFWAVAADAADHAQKAEERSDCVNNAVYYTYYVHGDDASYAQMKANLARCGTGFWRGED
jgi:hypothetical protein